MSDYRFTYAEPSASYRQRGGFILPHGRKEGLNFRPRLAETVVDQERNEAVGQK